MNTHLTQIVIDDFNQLMFFSLFTAAFKWKLSISSDRFHEKDQLKQNDAQISPFLLHLVVWREWFLLLISSRSVIEWKMILRWHVN